jgi:hypothetical protein
LPQCAIRCGLFFCGLQPPRPEGIPQGMSFGCRGQFYTNNDIFVIDKQKHKNSHDPEKGPSCEFVRPPPQELTLKIDKFILAPSNSVVKVACA